MVPASSKVTDPAQLDAELRSLLPALQAKESEQTWNAINDAVERWTAVTKSCGHKQIRDAYTAALKKIVPYIQTAILSDRSKLSRSAIELVEAAATALGTDFEPLTELFVPTVIKLSTRANKLFVQSATTCLKNLAEKCSLTSQLDTFTEALQNKNRFMRACAADVVVSMIEHTAASSLADHVEEVEAFVALAVEDADSAVRDLARACFSLYSERFGSRLDLFQAKLSPKARKYLSLQTNQPAKRPSLKEIKSMALRNREKGQDGSFVDGLDLSMDVSMSDAYGAGAAGKLNLSKPNFESAAASSSYGAAVPPTPGAALGIARRKARPSVLPGMEPDESFTSNASLPPSMAAKDVLDRSGNTIAAALSLAQRVPKNVEPAAAAGKGPVRRMGASGAQRVMVAQKAEPKPAPAPTVPVLDARIPTLPHAAPVSSDAPAPAPAPAPGPEPVVSKPVTRSAAAIASSHVSDRAGARSAIPILSDVSSKVTTRSAAAMDEPDLHLPPPKLTVASFKAPLWNTRLAAFETLQRSLAEPATSELDFAPSKIAEILSLGLDDTHVKIASCAMQSLKPFIEKHPAESRYLELFLGRVLSAAKSSSSTSRQPTTSVASDILEMFKKSCDPEALLHSSLNVLTASDWAKVSRVKLGALDLVGGVLAENAMIAGRSSTMRTLVTKLTAFISDIDQLSSKRLRSLLTSLESAHSAAFFTAVCQGLKPSERKLLRSILIKDVPDWDAKEKAAWGKAQDFAKPTLTKDSADTSRVLPSFPRSPVKTDTQETLVLEHSSSRHDLTVSRVTLPSPSRRLGAASSANLSMADIMTAKQAPAPAEPEQQDEEEEVPEISVVFQPLSIESSMVIQESADKSIGDISLPATSKNNIANLTNMSFDLAAVEMPTRRISMATTAAIDVDQSQYQMEQEKTQDLIAFDVSVLLPAGMFPVLAATGKSAAPAPLEEVEEKKELQAEEGEMELADLVVPSEKESVDVSVEIVAEASPAMGEAVAVESEDVKVEEAAEEAETPQEATGATVEDPVESILAEVIQEEALRSPIKMAAPAPATPIATFTPRSSVYGRTPALPRLETVLTPQRSQIIERLQHEITVTREQSRQEIAVLEAEIAESRKQYEAQLLDIQASRDALVAQHEASLQSVSQTAQSAELMLREEINQLEGRIAGLQRELTSLRESHDTELAELETKLHERVKELEDTLEAERAAAQRDLESLTALQDSFTAEVEELKSSLSATREELANAEESRKTLEDICSTLEAQITDKDQRIEELQCTIGQLEAKVAEASGLAASVEMSHNNDTEAARKQLEDLAAEREMQLDELRKQLEAVEAEKSSLEQNLESAKTTISAKEADLEALRSELLTSQTALREAEAAGLALRTEHDLRAAEDEKIIAGQREEIEKLGSELMERMAEIDKLRTSSVAGSGEWTAKMEEATTRLREEHARAIADLATEHERHVEVLRSEYRERIEILESAKGQTEPADPDMSPSDALQATLRDMEARLAAMTAEREHHAAQIAQLKSENEIKRTYLEQTEERLVAERRESEEQYKQQLATQTQRIEDLMQLLKESETAYDHLHRVYNAEVHGIKEMDESDEFLDAEAAPDEISTLDQAIELALAEDVTLATFEYVLTMSHPTDIGGEALGTLCGLSKENDKDGLSLCKILLLAQDSIAINPAIVENNEETAIDLLAVGAVSVGSIAPHIIPDLKLCLEKLTSSIAEAILPQRIAYTAHYILSLELASAIPYMQTLFTRLVLLMKDADGQRIAHRIASVILASMQADDIEMRRTAYESLALLYNHVGRPLLRELSKEMAATNIPNAELMRFSIKKRLGITDEDLEETTY